MWHYWSDNSDSSVNISISSVSSVSVIWIICISVSSISISIISVSIISKTRQRSPRHRSTRISRKLTSSLESLSKPSKCGITKRRRSLSNWDEDWLKQVATLKKQFTSTNKSQSWFNQGKCCALLSPSSRKILLFISLPRVVKLLQPLFFNFLFNPRDPRYRGY